MSQSPLTEAERRQLALDLLQRTMDEMARELGFTVEPSLQTEPVTASYSTTRAVLVLRSLPTWQAQSE